MNKQNRVNDAESRFWARVAQKGVDDCWPWLGGHCAGYGWLYLGGGRKEPVNEYAHRLALYYATRKWGVAALHTCDNRPCCNPKHLYWGTKKDNSQDALKRQRAYVGEKNSNAKLTDERVRTILNLRTEGKLLREIEAETGVSESLISKVCRREVWAHV